MRAAVRAAPGRPAFYAIGRGVAGGPGAPLHPPHTPGPPRYFAPRAAGAPPPVPGPPAWCPAGGPTRPADRRRLPRAERRAAAPEHAGPRAAAPHPLGAGRTHANRWRYRGALAGRFAGSARRSPGGALAGGGGAGLRAGGG